MLQKLVDHLDHRNEEKVREEVEGLDNVERVPDFLRKRGSSQGDRQ